MFGPWLFFLREGGSGLDFYWAWTELGGRTFVPWWLPIGNHPQEMGGGRRWSINREGSPNMEKHPPTVSVGCRSLCRAHTNSNFGTKKSSPKMEMRENK